MSNMEVTQVFLKSRPGLDNAPSESNFGVRNGTIKLDHDSEKSWVLVKTLYLSVDPALR